MKRSAIHIFILNLSWITTRIYCKASSVTMIVDSVRQKQVGLHRIDRMLIVHEEIEFIGGITTLAS